MLWYYLVNYNKYSILIWSILRNFELWRNWKFRVLVQTLKKLWQEPLQTFFFFAVITTPDNNLMRGFTPKMVDFVSGSLVLGKVMAKGHCEDNSQDTDRKEPETNVFFQSLLWSTFSSQASHQFSPPLNNAIKVWVHQWLIIDQVRALCSVTFPRPVCWQTSFDTWAFAGDCLKLTVLQGYYHTLALRGWLHGKRTARCFFESLRFFTVHVFFLFWEYNNFHWIVLAKDLAWG